MVGGRGEREQRWIAAGVKGGQERRREKKEKREKGEEGVGQHGRMCGRKEKQGEVRKGTIQEERKKK